MVKVARVDRIRAIGRVVTVTALWLAACNSSSNGLGGGAGGTPETQGQGGSGGLAISSGGAVGAGAGGMILGMGGMMMDAGGTMMGNDGAGGASTGASCHALGTLQVTSSGASAYVIDGVSNPSLTLCRGSTYVFAVNAPGHPFYINTVQGTGTSNAYGSGVTGNGTTSGNVTFVVPSDAPDTLFYDCAIHAAMTGTIHIMD